MSSDINVQTFSGKVNITSNLLVGTSHLFVDTINNRVGLVTNTPDAGLHVNSNAYVHTDFRVGSGIVMNDTTGRITAGAFHGDGTNITGINSDSGSWVNGTDVVYLSTIGDKVGIGTTNPQYRLDVGHGGGATLADDVMLRVMSSSGTSGKLIFGRSGTTDIRSHAIESYNTAGSGNNYMKFLVHDGTGTAPYETRTEVMTLLGNGNVGIGTTTPTVKLHLYQSAGSTNLVEKHTNASTGQYQQHVNYTHYASVAGGASRDPDNSRGLWIGNMVDENDASPSGANFAAFTDSFQFYAVADRTKYDSSLAFTSNTDNLLYSGGTFVKVMKIDANGNVGIGTTSPTELLDITAASGDYDAFIRLRSGSGGTDPVTESGLKLTESGEYGFQFAHSGATDLLKIRHQNSAGNVDLDNIMVWHPNGNVGIGTSSPQGALHVAGSSGSSNTSKALGIHMGVLSGGGESYAHMEIVCNNSNSGWIDFKNANTSGNGDFEERIRGGDGNLVFHTNKSERMRINASGNVGIGTTNPTAMLHVNAGTGVATRIMGSAQWANRPFAMMGRSGGRIYAPNVFVCNVTGYNSGIANTSNGRFTAPTGFSGYYLCTYSGLAGASETGPNDRWYRNGVQLQFGSAHVNSAGNVPSRWGMSAQSIVYLSQGDYVEHRVITGSLYGSASVHSTHIVMYLHS